MMTAARILRPSREGWKLLVSALKQRWLSMAIWSWKVLPVRGSCGHKAASGPPRGARRAERPLPLARAGPALRVTEAPAKAQDYVTGQQVKSQLHPRRSQQDPTKREHQK